MILESFSQVRRFSSTEPQAEWAGLFAVQIAKFLGAEVTGVCRTRNVDMVRSLGAKHVIDYTQADFTLGGARIPTS